MCDAKLTYFDGRGIAEPIRLVLTYAEVPFEDVRLASLTPEKKEELGLEWGQLPILEVNGEKKAQSWAIVRYLAKKYNLAGKTETEQFRADELVEAVRDFFTKGLPLFFAKYANDTAKLEELKKSFATVDAPPMIKRFNDLLEKQGKTWLVGDSLTYADIMLAHYITHFDKVFSLQLVKDYPAILKHVAAVENDPKIKKWIENRPVTDF